MKRNIFLVIIGILLCSSAFGQSSYKTNFNTALNVRNMTKAEEILKAWDYADANDPELYVSYFNFYTVKSMDAGFLSATGYDEKYVQKALEYITEGIDRFPTRFDMRVAKIYMLGQLKDYPAYASEAVRLISYSDKIKNGWKGEDFSLVEKPDEMFNEAILDCQEFLFSKEDPSLYKYMIQISEEMLKYYPKDVQSRLSLSTVYIAQREYDKSLEVLLKANDIDPRNSILLYNIAYVYNLKDDKVNAKKYYELTIKYIKEKEEKLKEAAEKRLEALK